MLYRLDQTVIKANICQIKFSDMFGYISHNAWLPHGIKTAHQKQVIVVYVTSNTGRDAGLIFSCNYLFTLCLQR
jgi:hypothetical protein